MCLGMNVILVFKKVGVKNFLNLSSLCMYFRNVKNFFNEDFILKGELEFINEGYVIVKIVSICLCEYIYKEDESLLYKIVILCNLYGCYDKFDFNYFYMIFVVI